MQDNRRSPRCAIRWRCAVVVEERGRQETIQTKTNDISISGVSVICHRNIPPPHAVTVYLLVDAGDDTRPQVIVEAQGSIMNNVLSGQQGGYRLGIQFTKFMRDGKQVLQKYLPKEIAHPAQYIAPAPVVPAAEAKAAEETPAAPTEAGAADASSEETPPASESSPAEEAKPAAEDAAGDSAEPA